MYVLKRKVIFTKNNNWCIFVRIKLKKDGRSNFKNWVCKNPSNQILLKYIQNLA